MSWKGLKFEVSIKRIVACELLWNSGELSEMWQKTVTLGLDECSSQVVKSELVNVGGMCALYVFVCSLVHLGTVFCTHVVFLSCETVPKQMQNLHYAQIAP